MSKQITTSELSEIITTLLTTDYIDDASLFSDFMREVAQVVCDYCGGEILNDPDCWLGEWLVGVHANDCLPEDGGVWKNYDLDGEL